jgi:hypothetical protein
MNAERAKELRESARWAITHGNGQITVQASELLEMLPKESAAPAPVAVAPVAQPASEPTPDTATDLEKPIEIDFGTGKNAQVAEIVQETADGPKVTPGPAFAKLEPALQHAGPVAVPDVSGVTEPAAHAQASAPAETPDPKPAA